MKISKLMLGFIILLAIFIAVGCGDDDNPTNSAKIPAELVGTWQFQSAIIDGESVSDFSEVANNSSADYAYLTHNADGTWSENEYTIDDSLAYSQSGTFTVKGDTIYLVVTAANGDPVSPPVASEPGVYGIVEPVLTIVSGGRFVMVFTRVE
jgi:hypothetical protein